MAALQAALGMLKGSQNTTDRIAAVSGALLCYTSHKQLDGEKVNAGIHAAQIYNASYSL